MVFEARKKALSAPSKVPPNLATCHKPLILYGFYGGDDGARTRDLCRDSKELTRNLLKTGAMDDTNSALRNPWRPLLHP
jgi:hypothetical protein